MILTDKPEVSSTVQHCVRDIFIYRNIHEQEESILPFYPDGYPGIVYLEAESATAKLRVEKPVSHLFLYGQSTHPVTLAIKKGKLMMVFRITPDICHHILNANSELINDDCIDLSGTHCAANDALTGISGEQDLKEKAILMTRFIDCLTKDYKSDEHAQILKAVQIIARYEGNIPISEVHNELFMSERTFQRKFKQVVGVTPKQWSIILRFHHSKNSLSKKESKVFADVVHGYGFTDQSHFIKLFRRYTGKTPVEYLNLIRSNSLQPLD